MESGGQGSSEGGHHDHGEGSTQASRFSYNRNMGMGSYAETQPPLPPSPLMQHDQIRAPDPSKRQRLVNDHFSKSMM